MRPFANLGAQVPALPHLFLPTFLFGAGRFLAEMAKRMAPRA
jgi:hypothetical protein